MLRLCAEKSTNILGLYWHAKKEAANAWHLRRIPIRRSKSGNAFRPFLGAFELQKKAGFLDF
jgi:hypothetical protein